ncbi:class II fructose-bisphosphate aldolase [Streptomyces sp. NBC_01460]|uniref:class II fructose-bisphosphate aldolase n=1 Tax=Streptomyces sp. NBC_01460 TaxID=2903875 RepID=UPI002E3314AD|nr:class II fructose-bisphosphate aldolase [Streptomyces sp. NBC_01460]
MPIATPEVYAEMLDRAKAGKFAYPAINVTSTQTLHAALRGFAEAESDGIVQISTGGAEFLGGQYNKDMVTGAVALAEFAHIVAAKYDITVALHTDHCPKDKLDAYVRPLLDVSAERVAKGLNPLFQSHMWDGSAETLADNLSIGQELRVTHEINDELYTTVDDALRTAEALGLGEKGRYLLAASFGNVHGVYKPGNVVLRPELLKDLQQGVSAKYGKPAGSQPFDFVFHGGSGSTAEEIATALENGVVKMNLDTDTQYAFTRPVADHMFRNYDGVLKVDGEVGNKKTYDPRTWGKAAEAGMAVRVTEACANLRSSGTKLK